MTQPLPESKSGAVSVSSGGSADRDQDLSQPNRSLAELVWNFISASNIANARFAARLGVSPKEVEMLTLLMETDEELGPVALSRRLGVSSAATTQSSARLVSSGYLKRKSHVSDRRRQILQVTSEGSEHVMEQLSPLLGLVESAGDDFDEAEHEVVKRYLIALLDAYAAYASVSPSITPASPPRPSAGPPRSWELDQPDEEPGGTWSK